MRRNDKNILRMKYGTNKKASFDEKDKNTDINKANEKRGRKILPNLS